MHFHATTAVLALSLALSAGCSDDRSAGTDTAGVTTQKKLDITGSSTVAPLLLEIAKRFEYQHPGIRIDVQTGGSSRGIADVRRGTADIGMVSRTLDDSEADLVAHIIARDGVCVILRRDNPLSEITSEQIVSIYTGKVSNWKAIGGDDAEIVVVNKAAGRATLAVFLDHFGLDSSDIEADVIIGHNQQAIKTIAGNARAIGYVSIGTAEYEREHGTPIKLLPLDGVEASTETVARGTFPMSRSLLLVTDSEPRGLSREFIDFAQSTEVADLITAQYFVPSEH